MHNGEIKCLIENASGEWEARNKLLQPYAEMIQRMNAEQMRKQMKVASLTRDMDQIVAERKQLLKEHCPKAINYLFEEGWYVGGGMPLQSYKILAKMVDTGSYTDIEKSMCEWARTKTDGVIENAVHVFPLRAQILRDAAGAHREGKYTLSIPVFFAQSDGMAKDIIGNCLFLGNPPKALEKILTQFADFPLSDVSNLLLEPLRARSRFYTCSPKQATKGGVALANRSEVMHGAQLDYASEANSLRGIVLLGYLVGVKSFFESRSKHVAELRRIVNKALSADKHPNSDESGGK